jgi:predicted nucleotidyltransferase
VQQALAVLRAAPVAAAWLYGSRARRWRREAAAAGRSALDEPFPHVSSSSVMTAAGDAIRPAFDTLFPGDLAGDDSDFDLAVLWAAHAGSGRRHLLGVLERELAVALGTPRVSVVDVERAPLLLRHRVLRDGVLLVESDPRLRARFAERCLVRYVRTRALRRELDRGTLRRLAR